MVAHNLTRYAINVSDYVVWIKDVTINSQCNSGGFSQLFLIEVYSSPSKKKDKRKEDDC